jgi:Smg protein
MFDVLVYVYENYWRPDACPAAQVLSRKLSAAGFEHEEIEEALNWLDGLAARVEPCVLQPQQPGSRRVYTAEEQECLGTESLSFLSFLESANVLTPDLREVVLERATAAGQQPMDLEDLKIIVLMVFWSLGEEPDALILDELFVDDQDRSIH